MHTSDGLGSNPGPESSLEPGFFGWLGLNILKRVKAHA